MEDLPPLAAYSNASFDKPSTMGNRKANDELEEYGNAELNSSRRNSQRTEKSKGNYDGTWQQFRVHVSKIMLRVIALFLEICPESLYYVAVLTTFGVFWPSKNK